MTKLNVVVIGAGLSGLCAAKYALQSGHSVTIYEQTASVGGTWIYTDATGTDEYGIDIHTSMYHDLRTNLPKEIMGFSDYPMPSTLRKSYIGSEKVVEYLEDYAKHFNVIETIKFRHHVIRVRPLEETKWEIIVKDLLHDKVETHIYDAIFVCIGVNSTPSMPKPAYSGAQLFQGRQSHSHNYRRASQFQGKNVLIIGAGPSGTDLTYLIAQTAKCVYFSHHTHNVGHIYSSNVVRIGPVKEFTETGAIFVDGSQHDVNEIVYCTGYKFAFPFLSADCGLCVEKHYVQPLYKHIININYPTMAIIGLPFTAAITQMVDIQVRYTMKFLNGDKTLPPESDMKTDCERYAEIRRAAGISKRKLHSLAGLLQKNYYDELSATADIENVRPIYMKIYEDSHARRIASPSIYRNDLYRIIDEEHFERTAIA